MNPLVPGGGRQRQEPMLRPAAAPDVVRPPAPRPTPWIDPIASEGGGIGDFANRLLEHSRLAAAVFAAVLVAGVFYAIFATPVYRVDALLQIDERPPGTPAGMPIGATTAPRAGVLTEPYLPVAGEMEILRSRELLLGAIDAAHADFDISVDNRFPLIGEWYARHYARGGASGVAPPPFGLGAFAWGGERLDLVRFDVPAYLYGDDFYVQPYTGGWMLFDADRRFVFSGPFGKDVALNFAGQRGIVRIDGITGGPRTRFHVVRNDPVATYADLQRDLRIVEAARMAGVVRLSLDTSHPASATALLKELMRGYLDRGVQVRTADAERSLAFLENQLPTVRTNLEKAEDRLSTFRARTRSVNLDQQSESAFMQVQQLERSRVELELKERDLAQRFGPAHPQMRTVRQQLAAVKRQLGDISNTFTRLPANERDLVRLQRDVTTSAALYTSMLNSIQELKVARAGMVGNARVVDAPRPSAKPVQPKALVVLSVAAGLGAVAAMGAALLAGMLRPTIRDADEIEAGVGLPAVVTVPESARERVGPGVRLPFGPRRSPLLTVLAPEEAAVESLRSFRMQLTRGGPGPPPRSILITSATAGAGKTFVAANLSALLAASGRRVLLIEGDMRHPRLNTYFGVPRSPGLADVLAGSRNVEDVLHRAVLPGVDLLTPGTPIRNPADLLSSPRLAALLDEFGARYEHVVFDSVPILPAGDSLAIAQLPVATFLVARSEHTTLGEVQEAVRRLDGIGADLRGVVFNGAKRMRISNVRYGAYRAVA